MKAVLLTKPEEIRIIDLPEPSAPGPGEALVRTHRMGICGTDLSGYLGKMPFFSYPRIPGHELGLEVLAVGEGVGNVKAGGLDAVIAPNIGETNVIGMNLLSRLASWRVEGETMILVPHNPQPAG